MAYIIGAITGEKARAKPCCSHFAKEVGVTIVDFANIAKMNSSFSERILIIDNFVPTLLVEAEEKLCHLYDHAVQAGKHLMLVGRTFEISQIERTDCKHRLPSALHVSILPPDDILGPELILKYFSEKQLKVTPEIINYIWSHAPRSYHGLHILVATIDELALKKHADISIPLVKEAIASFTN